MDFMAMAMPIVGLITMDPGVRTKAMEREHRFRIRDVEWKAGRK